MAARLKALRRPPAYQTYATDDLASARYYTLTLAERGLLDAMRRVYWADDGIPADLDSLALSVRRPKEEVQSAFTEHVQAHFTNSSHETSKMTCPVLAGQMAEAMDKRLRQSKGGQKGAKRTNDAKTKSPSKASSTSSSKPSSKPAASEMSGDEVSRGEHQVEGDDSEYSDEYWERV